MKKKLIIGIGSAVVAVAAIFAVWRTVSGRSTSSAGDITLYADSVGMLTGTGLGTQNRFAGIVESQNTLNITLESDQTVKDIFVEKGQTVEAGTPLFQYDTEEMNMKLEQANLELEKLENSITSLNAQITDLTKEKKNAPESEQLSYTTQIQELQTNVKQEEYNYKVKELEIGRLRKSMESAQVNSTIAGIVQEINETPSYDTYTGEQQPFMSILAVGKYRIKGTISEQNMQNLYTGMPVAVHSRVDEDLVWYGTVDSIDTEKPISDSSGMISDSGVSAQATKYPFYVNLESSDGLMLGQHVYLEPDTGMDEKNGMWLMSSYIVREENEDPYVWMAGDNDKLKKQTVTLGEYNEADDTWEILEGLKASDYIAWPGADCAEGVSVMKNSSSMPAPAGDAGDMELPDSSDPEEPVNENLMPTMREGL